MVAWDDGESGGAWQWVSDLDLQEGWERFDEFG